MSQDKQPISTEERDKFAQKVRAWLKRNMPSKPDFRLPLTFMEIDNQAQFDYLRDWQCRVYEAGYLGMSWPAEYGGGGLPQVYQDIVTREMARLQAPFMLNAIGLSWAGPTILKLGTEAQKKRYIKKILSAEEIWCQGFSEPENGSDLGNAQTRAVRDGDSYVINGSKIWTSQAEYAAHMLLIARTDPEAPNKYAGLSFFLAPMDTPGIEIRRIRKMTGEYGFAQTFFDDARIPADTLVGEEGQGWNVAMAVLAFERGAALGQAGGNIMSVITSRDLVETARKSLRDGRPALEDVRIREQLVQFMIEERCLRLGRQRGRDQRLLTPGREFAPMLLGKLQGSEYMRRMAAFAVSMQGGQAPLYVDDPMALDGGVWQRQHMNSYSATIGGGTSEIQRNIIGERLLGLGKG